MENCHYPSYNVETLRATSHCERVIGRRRDGARPVSTKMQWWRRCTQRLYKCNVFGHRRDAKFCVSTNVGTVISIIKTSLSNLPVIN